VEQNIHDAARYMGTVCHQIEDYGSPSHTMPGDNMFTLLQQFLPPSETMRDVLLHGPVESGSLVVSISGYNPRLLGTSVNEAAWRLMHRIHEGILNARSTTIPIIQALYAGVSKQVKEEQLKAAKVDAEIVADAMFTILSLGCHSAQELNDSKRRCGDSSTSPSARFFQPRQPVCTIPNRSSSAVPIGDTRAAVSFSPKENTPCPSN
jgi:hypothetical protein